MTDSPIAVIGAGAAGLMAAGYAAELGADVLLFERNKMPAKKLLITGKGRCNVTNNCTITEFMENVPTNPRFLYAALNAFEPADTIAFFEDLGVPLKTERGNRVFPQSDRSADIAGALKRYVNKSGRVKLVHERVQEIISEKGCVTSIKTDKAEYSVSAAILATGGASYTATGSDGDGYRMAERLGHTVMPLKPSLVPIVTEEKWCAELQGLSLRNTGCRVIDTKTGKCVYEDFGELMFTHFGITGPMVLSASSRLGELTPGRYQMKLDLKPALDEKTLDNRILSDFSKYANKDFINSLSDLLPSKLIPVVCRLSGIASDKKVNAITREERRGLLMLLKGLTVTLKAYRPLEEAIITSGGISVKEIEPGTMRSKLVDGLYFAGEVIDVDAYTGGFNLQIAFATARLAAWSVVTGC
ncbi:MAG: NAD(P)/FAD-dependent oxidoreductase [Clostridia bacterium]|nr:NAD(P)/FAD-dependent oxidoreductase [Clostridia bacterium]